MIRVWRLKSDNSVIGACDEANTMFEPGGDLAAYVVSIEPVAPVIPVVLSSQELKRLDAISKLDTASKSGAPQDIADALAAVRDVL